MIHSHTPGPWKAAVAPCGTRTGLLAPSGAVAMLGVSEVLNPADVRLIETSPDLLAELVATAEWLDGIAGEVEAIGPIPLVKGNPGAITARQEAIAARCRAAVKLRGRAVLIRTAIAKAKGGGS